MAKAFCPDCGSEELKTCRGPPGTACNVCGWSGDLWEGHRSAMEVQENEIKRLRGLLSGDSMNTQQREP